MNSPRFQHAGQSYALLTWTSAMACWSWSLPAGREGACPAEHRGPNSICSSCYAQQGNYLFRNVRETQAARFAFLKSDPNHFADILVRFLHLEDPSFFRVHDSGDFHSLPTIHLWRSIVDRCPSTRFWFPTRTYLFLTGSPPFAPCTAGPMPASVRRPCGSVTNHPSSTDSATAPCPCRSPCPASTTAPSPSTAVTVPTTTVVPAGTTCPTSTTYPTGTS